MTCGIPIQKSQIRERVILLPLVLITIFPYTLKNPLFGKRNLGNIRLVDAKSPSGLIYLTYCQSRKEETMIKPLTMYSVVCDRCGKIFETDGCIAWTDKQSSIYYALASEWKEIGDKHYCPDCYEFNDVLNVYVPKKKVD